MWAKLSSQRGAHVILTAAEAALEHPRTRRNEPFIVHTKRQLDFVITSSSRKETRRRKLFYPDIDLDRPSRAPRQLGGLTNQSQQPHERLAAGEERR
jgi:hypothetical protein